MLGAISDFGVLVLLVAGGDAPAGLADCDNESPGNWNSIIKRSPWLLNISDEGF